MLTTPGHNAAKQVFYHLFPFSSLLNFSVEQDTSKTFPFAHNLLSFVSKVSNVFTNNGRLHDLLPFLWKTEEQTLCIISHLAVSYASVQNMRPKKEALSLVLWWLEQVRLHMSSLDITQSDIFSMKSYNQLAWLGYDDIMKSLGSITVILVSTLYIN